LISACSGGDGNRTHTKRRRASTTTTTTSPPVPRAPLSNTPDPDGVARGRSSLAVKIENTPEARPQSGLDVADIVYEEVVEGGITRFWAVFNSGAPGHVGPVRSVRHMDPDIVSPLGGVVTFSGGTEPNVALIRQAPVVTVDENNAGDAFYRERSREAPHNLYGRPELLWQRGGQPVPPNPLFEYLKPGEHFNGEPVKLIKVGFQAGYDPTYAYDAKSGSWKRSYGFARHDAESGQQIAPRNLIIQFVQYVGAGGEGQLIGSGDAWVLSRGRMVKGRWSKGSPTEATKFTDPFGAPIRLRSGQTWVELLPIGAGVNVVP
jgi:hypothetical protein